MNHIMGQRFGRLIAIKPTDMRAGTAIMWEVKCDCGNNLLVRIDSLMSGITKSCGCLQRERAGEAHLKHGHARIKQHTPEYRTWINMTNRCSNPKRKNYRWYGGRGIIVCERWKKFENFLSDMGPKPTGKSIDRIDPNGNYEPSNCRWATQEEQTNNRRPRESLERPFPMK
jgi:hypothetical protein